MRLLRVSVRCVHKNDYSSFDYSNYHYKYSCAYYYDGSHGA